MLNESNTKILVVGGAGYIGSHVVRELLNQGHLPIVLDNLSTGHAWAVQNANLVRGDLGDCALLRQLFSEHSFTAVMHFASHIQVGESVIAPLKYYQNNVANTLNLLSAMHEAGVKSFVFSSTAAVYGTPSTMPITESADLNPENPYGRSKLMIEQVLDDCDMAWGLKSACLRYFNAAGADPSGGIGEAHDPESHLIPIILEVALGLREAITINGNDYDTADGTCVRDYIHVCDLAGAHLLALQELLAHNCSIKVNLGNGRGYSILEVLHVCRKVTGHPIPVTFGARRLGDPSRLIASADNALRLLKWKPRFSELETIVQTAWEWQKYKQKLFP